MVSPVRRSSRARKPATTIYDEAAELEQERRRSLKEKKENRDDDESAEEESDDSEESDIDSDSDEDASVSKEPPKKKKKVTPTKTKRTQETTIKATRGLRPRNATVSAKTAFTKARITQALKMLSKSVLNNHGGDDSNNQDENDEDETPQTSLVAAILASAKPVPGITSTTRPKSYYYSHSNKPEESMSEREKRTNAIVTTCLPQLDGIVRHLVKTTEHQGPHELHVRLLNLLFRSVGGSTKTNIDAQTDLDELEDDDWDEIISNVVTVMKNESDADQTLLIADDDADEDAPTMTTRQIGILAYRTLYKEFWYRLGHVLLAHSPSPAVAMVSDEEEDEEESDSDSDSENNSASDESDSPKSRKRKSSSTKKRKKKSKEPTQAFSSNRFQLEKVRDLILRMTELVSVGQPDFRAAGTTAVMQLAKACVERTVELEQKIKVASRQLKAASRTGSKRKQQGLSHQLDNWKRHKAELEEIVEGPVIQGVFIHRYRDTNETIRRDCLRALSEISLIRPDVFLVDTYLKYFGWMASDKVACVRVAALEGLLAPFREAGWSDDSPIDVTTMQNVTLKFLSRIVDCTDDAQSTHVQELATKLLLSMLREEFLDEWEDDVGWDKVNLKALDALSSERVRRDALYFVMDQLDAFDTDGKGADAISEKKQSEQLVAIARWCANKLCDGMIPLEKMNIELVDCIVHSILDMPEHKELISNWPMILKAIRSENPQQGSANEREEIATQRILLRILATSAKLELENSKDSAGKKPKPAVTSKRRRSSGGNAEARMEQLSVALLKNLPHLLDSFKSDTLSLRDVTKLPSTITLSVLGLPSRKTDFQNLVKTLCQLYLDSTDEQTLQNIAETLSKWVEGDHTRLSEVKVNLKRLSRALQDRLMKLFRESDPQEVASQNSKSSKRRSLSRRSLSEKDGDSSAGGSTMFSASPEADAEHSIALIMLRWYVLLMQCEPEFLFEEADGEEDEDEIEGLFFTISEAMGKRLSDRMPNRDDEGDEDATAVTNRTIWKELDPEVHEEVAVTIQRSLKVLLLIVSWELNGTLTEQKEFENSDAKDNDDDMEIDEYNYPVLKFRDNLVNLLGLCFDQHLPENEAFDYTNEQEEFAYSVQASAGQVASDLRTLFPYDWSKSSDPVRRALALTNGEDFAFLLSGFARWFQSREDITEDIVDSTHSLVEEALLPLARVTTMNFDGFFRKEAAMIMQHISGSGSLASQTLLALSRTLKKTNPVRMLESQMACLRLAFENWLDTEPVVPEETEPTDEEIQAFEDAEKKHLDVFASMEQKASKLSSTLGVAGRLANDSLKKSIIGFVREGIRYSFDGSENNKQDEDDLVIGSRLAFLLILNKYSIWIRKEKAHLEQLSDFLLEKESELRRHPEFEEVHDDDLNALSDFKKSLGIKQKVVGSSEGNVIDDQSFSAATPSPATASSSRRGTLSGISKGSRTSRRSGMSVQSELSPLYEEVDAENVGANDDDENNDSNGSPTPQKRRRLDSPSRRHAEHGSVESSMTKSTYNRGSIPEENEEGNNDSENEE